MARIKIEDLPEDQTISQQEMKIIRGGSNFYDVNQKSDLHIILLNNILKSQQDTQYSIINYLK